MRTKKWRLIGIFIIIILVLILVALYLRTGFLQKSSIDERDLAKWEYEDGLIKGVKGFILPGSNETCWYLIHGYTSTPAEMKQLAKRINSEFNETVVVTRLKGHGEVPSKISDLTLNDWYKQVDLEVEELSKSCDKINLVGFSFGGALSTRLVEEKELNHVYLIAPYFETTYHFYYVFSMDRYMKIFNPIIHYSKKIKVGKINSPEGLKNHIAYWNMPFSPVTNSKEFLEKTFSDLSKINEPILIQHSKSDVVSDIKTSKIILDQVSSEKKQLITFSKSNHILLADYDKDQVIQNIIVFEKELRAS